MTLGPYRIEAGFTTDNIGLPFALVRVEHRGPDGRFRNEGRGIALLCWYIMAWRAEE